MRAVMAPCLQLFVQLSLLLCLPMGLACDVEDEQSVEHEDELAWERRDEGVLRVRLFSPTVSDGLQKLVIRRIVRAHTSELRHCVTQARTRSPGVAGEVVVRFDIGPLGEVVRLEIVDETLDEAEAVDCIETAVGRWKFPQPQGAETVTVVYPFGFGAPFLTRL